MSNPTSFPASEAPAAHTPSAPIWIAPTAATAPGAPQGGQGTSPVSPPPSRGTPAPAAPASRKNGLGLASLVIGGVTLLLSPVPVVNVIGGLAAIAGIVLGIVALARRDRSRVTAIIGLPLSVVALAVSSVLVVVYSIAFTGWVEAVATDAESYVLTAQQPIVFEPGSDEPAAPGIGMSPESPAPFGSTVRDLNYGWDVSIGSPTLDATAEVTESYTLGHLEPGEQYASAPVTLTNLGPTRATPAVNMKFAYMTSDSRTLEPVSHLDGSVESLGGVDPGMTEQGTVVFAIPSDDGDRGVWAVRFEFMPQLVYFGNPTTD